MSSKKYKGSGYALDLDLLTVSYYSCVSYPRSGLVGRGNHLRPTYIKQPLTGASKIQLPLALIYMMLISMNSRGLAS